MIDSLKKINFLKKAIQELESTCKIIKDSMGSLRSSTKQDDIKLLLKLEADLGIFKSLLKDQLEINQHV